MVGRAPTSSNRPGERRLAYISSDQAAHLGVGYATARDGGWIFCCPHAVKNWFREPATA